MYGADYSDVSKDFLGLIKLKGDRPSYATLCNLLSAFGRFPYENFTKIIRAHESEDENRMRLPDIVLNEHVEFGAGGTCFSLTYFFDQVLKYLDYETYPVLCDRSYGPNTHCAIIVTLEGQKYLVDPGYLLDAPLKMPDDGVSCQNSSFQATQLSRLKGTSQLLLFTQREGRSKLRYRLKDAPVSAAAFKDKWLDSFDWAMIRHLCVSKITEHGQLYSRDGILRFHKTDSKSQETIRKNFVQQISKNFGINPQIIEAAFEYIERDKNDARVG